MIRRAAATAVLLAALTACSGGSDDTGDTGGTGASDVPSPATPSAITPSPATEPTEPADPAAPPVGPQYVALGDSYSAAPGVPETSGADGCFRSSGNYAQRIAARTGLTVTDVTCSGANSEDLLADQVPAITPAAELVTVSTGGNDFDLFARLIGGCLQSSGGDGGSGVSCSDASGAEVDQAIPQIAANIGGVLDAVVEAAPRAQVVVVGYPDLLPEKGSCPDRIPLAAGDYAFVNDVTHRLSDALASEAAERGLDFVDLEGPSEGHDICSDVPWVNGASVAEDGTAPLHPFAREQQAVAALVTAFL